MIGLQKAQSSKEGGGYTITHEVHIMECWWSPRCTKKRNSRMVSTRMRHHCGMYTGNQAKTMQNTGLEYGGERILGGFPSGICKRAGEL